MQKALLTAPLFLAAITVFLSAACAPASPTPERLPATSTPMSEGQVLYTQSCAPCHGYDAEGTDMGPAVAGQSIRITKAQVRDPMGHMPAFPLDQLSDRDLEDIAQFIASLKRAPMSLVEWGLLATPLLMLALAIAMWAAFLRAKPNRREPLQSPLTSTAARGRRP